MQQIDEVDGGYRIGCLPEDAQILNLAEFVSLERRCCPFLTFAIELDAEGGGLWLRMTGPAGVKEFLTLELGLQRDSGGEG